MEFKYKLTEKDTIEAMQLHGQGRKITRIILVIMGIILVFIGILTPFKLISFLSVVGGIAGYFITLKVIIPFRAKRQFRELKALQNEITINLSDSGLVFSSDSGESRLKWSDINRWKYNKNICLVYITSNMFHIIPFNVVTENSVLQKLYELLREHVGPEST